MRLGIKIETEIVYYVVTIINFWFLPKYTDVCSTVYSVLAPSPVKKITGILLGWDSNPRPLQF